MPSSRFFCCRAPPSSLGHTNEAWENADVQKMYLEAVKWAMKRTEGGTTPNPKVN